MNASRTLLLILTAGALAGCELPFGTVCTTDIRFGLVVEVRDAVTGAPAASGAQLTARDGEYVETTDERQVVEGLTLVAAAERPGTYDVTVQKSGYQDWTRSGIRVRKDECHVIPVRLDARLQPTP